MDSKLPTHPDLKRVIGYREYPILVGVDRDGNPMYDGYVHVPIVESWKDETDVERRCK